MIQATVSGRLTRDPEAGTSPSGTSYATFSIASRKRNGEGADFIECVAFAPVADIITNYLAKGSYCVVSGNIDISSYTPQGSDRAIPRFRLIVNQVELGPKNGNGNGNGGGDEAQEVAEPAAQPAAKKVLPAAKKTNKSAQDEVLDIWEQ